MIEAITYKAIVDCINKEIRTYSKRVVVFDSVDPVAKKAMIEINSKINRHSFVAILFCNPRTKFFKDELLCSLDYLHHRSGKYVNFFCCGFGAYWPENMYKDQEKVSKINDVEWSFSSEAFVSVIEEFENKTKWKYSGENEVLILDVSPSSILEELCINNAIVCNLEVMKKDQAFTSVRAFFEGLIRYAASRENADAWKFSDQQGGQVALACLKESILGLFPNSVKAAYKKAENYAVRQI